jgi:hypothetical protein
MDETNMPVSNAPQKGPRSRALLYIIVAVCVAVVFLAVFIFKPAPAATAQTDSQASADANTTSADQRLDPFQLTSSLGSDIAQIIYGRVEGQDYSRETVGNNTDEYIMSSSIGYLAIPNEEDNLHFYTTATGTINQIEYYALVSVNDQAAFLDAYASKMNDLESIFGKSYETLYYKDAQTTTNADTSYTYQKIHDALSGNQPGIYVVTWTQNGVMISLKAYNIDQKNFALAVSFWSYGDATASATP